MIKCRLNLRDSNGQLVQKPTRFVTTAMCVANALSLRCTGGHEHAPVQGRAVGESGKLGAWTVELAHQILLGTLQQMMTEKDAQFIDASPAGDDDEMEHEDEAPGDEPDEGGDDPEQGDVEHEDDEPPPAVDNRPERRMTRSAGVIFEDRVPRTFEEWRQVPPTLRSAIRKLHEQYSHALYGDDLGMSPHPINL